MTPLGVDPVPLERPITLAEVPKKAKSIDPLEGAIAYRDAPRLSRRSPRAARYRPRSEAGRRRSKRPFQTRSVRVSFKRGRRNELLPCTAPVMKPRRRVSGRTAARGLRGKAAGSEDRMRPRSQQPPLRCAPTLQLR